MRRLAFPGFATLVLISIGCGNGAKVLPICEPTSPSLVARTIDAKPTIAGLTIAPRSGQCMVLPGCKPPTVGGDASAGVPCAEVRIGCFGAATGCDLTFTSVDGQSFVAASTIRKEEGTDYACTSNGQTIMAYAKRFDPNMITVDFSKDDAGASGD